MAWDRDDTELWKAYRKKPTPENRNAIIEHHMPMAQHCANHARNRFQGVPLELEEYLSHAVIGLIKAVENYRDNNGNKFCTYAWHCVESQILTGVRKAVGSDWKNLEKQAFLRSIKSTELLAELAIARNDTSQSDIKDSLEVALRNTDERAKRFISLHYFDGLNYREIAQREGVSHQRVMQVITRAFEKARNGSHERRSA